MRKVHYIIGEWRRYLPYSLFGLVGALFFVGVLTFFAVLLRAEDYLSEASEELFHVTHMLHMFLSALVTTAIFFKHEKKIFPAMLLGLIGAGAICGLGDSILPYLIGRFCRVDLELHLCAMEYPRSMMLFALSGVFMGVFISDSSRRSTQCFHSGHVLMSSLAVILYFIAFGLEDWLHSFGWVFLTILISAVIPCSISNVIFSLCFMSSRSIEPPP